jgi:hypothetical protein
MSVHHGQGTRQAEADWAGRGVRREPKLIQAATEELGFREELNVDFEPNHDFVR